MLPRLHMARAGRTTGCRLTESWNSRLSCPHSRRLPAHRAIFICDAPLATQPPHTTYTAEVCTLLSGTAMLSSVWLPPRCFIVPASVGAPAAGACRLRGAPNPPLGPATPDARGPAPCRHHRCAAIGKAQPRTVCRLFTGCQADMQQQGDQRAEGCRADAGGGKHAK